jgi:hypothetical protein
MKKEELWKIFCKFNPSFGDPEAKITLTGKGLRKLFDQSFDKGFTEGKQKGLEGTQQSYQNGFNAGHQAVQKEANNLNKDQQFQSVFNEIFKQGK